MDNQEAILTAGRGRDCNACAWVHMAGVRTVDLKSAARFFADLLGLSPIHEGEGMVQSELPSGQLFEIFGPKSH